MKRTIKIKQNDPAFDARLTEIVRAVMAEKPFRDIEVTIDEPARTPEQHSVLRCRLRDIARQIKWSVDGVDQYIHEDDWKDIFTQAWKKQARIAAGIDGGFVMLGQRTSRMRKQEMSDLLELIAAFGAERGVRWSAPARYEDAA